MRQKHFGNVTKKKTAAGSFFFIKLCSSFKIVINKMSSILFLIKKKIHCVTNVRCVHITHTHTSKHLEFKWNRHFFFFYALRSLDFIAAALTITFFNHLTVIIAIGKNNLHISIIKTESCRYYKLYVWKIHS